MVIELTPEWEQRVKERYSGVDVSSHNLEKSCFGRYPSKLDNKVKGYFRDGGTKNILYVGLGRAEDGLCGPTVFEVAALMEGLGINYKMTILDINKELLDSVKKRDSLEFRCSFRTEQTGDLRPVNESIWERWLSYLQNTGQPIKGLDSLKRSATERKYVDATFNAGIPRTFKEKIGRGDITLEQGDIVTHDFSKNAPYDLVHCLNILCHLPIVSGIPAEITDREILLLAIHNLIRSLKKGGILLVDDIVNYNSDQFVNSCLVTNKFLEPKGIVKIDDVIPRTSKDSYVFIRKTS